MKKPLSNVGLAACSLIVFLCGAIVLGSGIWLATKHDQDCVRWLEDPQIVVGVLIMFVALIGIAGALSNFHLLTRIYVVLMFLLLLTLLAFTIFAFVVTRGGTHNVSLGKAYIQYRFSDYSDWLRNRVEGVTRWRKVRRCVLASGTCEDFSAEYRSLDELNKAKISPIEAGCCKPPDECAFVYMNATSWSNPLNRDANIDCYKWRNEQNVLCLDCNSCRAGVMQQVKSHWRTVAVIDLVVFLVMLFAFAVGAAASSAPAPAHTPPR